MNACSALPALGAGAAYALASGTPGQAPAMGLGFAAFSALFWKVCPRSLIHLDTVVIAPFSHVHSSKIH